MITVILRGKLGKRYGRKWTLAVDSPAKALNAIDRMKGGLFDYIWELESEMQGYHVQVGKRTVGKELLAFDLSGETVTITPILQGADTKGIVQIVAGVAIIAIGIAVSYYAAPLGFQLIGLGIAVALGGIARFLMSAPSTTTGSPGRTRSSYIFAGAVSTIQQGECVPACYGSPITGSAVVSAGVESYDVETN